MQKLTMRTPDFTDENIARLAELFPNCVIESRDENGTLKRAIDFDQLKQELSGSIVEGLAERYQLNWPGKREALLIANAPIAKTLRPCRQESVDFDTTTNLFIEGDNLDALKLLQETYLGRVKIIYIDPPYNTGNDFIYEDDFAEDKRAYFERSLQIDDQGNRLVSNADSNGRFHSDWITMIYSRLRLARNLLREDGIILISIDAGELGNLQKVCDEVFGERNFCGMYVWEKKKKPSFLNANMGTVTDYILAFAKNRAQSPAFAAGNVEDGKKYPFNNAGNSINILTFPAESVTFACEDQIVEAQEMSEGNIVTRLLDPVTIKGGRNVEAFRLEGEWRYSQGKLEEFIRDHAEIIISKVPFRPNYVKRSGDLKKTANLLSHRTNGVPTNEDATNEIRQLFGADVMSHPKPSGLLEYLVRTVTTNDDIVLDFFAGSATTAHAVISLNASDGGTRRFIMVQLPEIIDPVRVTDPGAKEIASRANEFLDSIGRPHTVAEIGKERIRRVGKYIRSRAGLTAGNLDIGFRVLKTDTSNMKDVYYTPDTTLQADLLDQISNIKEDRTLEDLLFQVLLDWGVDLGLPISSEMIDGKRVFFVDNDALAACFEDGLDEEFFKEVAQRKPLRAVFRDSCFASDDIKINLEQIFRLISPGTEIRAV